MLYQMLSMLFVGEAFVAPDTGAASALVLLGQQAVAVLLLLGAGPREEEALLFILFYTRAGRLIYPGAAVFFRMEDPAEKSLVALVACKVIGMAPAAFAVKNAAAAAALVPVLLFTAPDGLSHSRCRQAKSQQQEQYR